MTINRNQSLDEKLRIEQLVDLALQRPLTSADYANLSEDALVEVGRRLKELAAEGLQALNKP